jgi:hypothetical protein
VQCKDGECWEVCKTHDWTCCPCSSLDIDPDNLTATPLSETSVRLDWTPKGSFSGQGVQQYIQCNIDIALGLRNEFRVTRFAEKTVDERGNE